MKRRLPHILPICPDCGMGYWAHSFQSTGNADRTSFAFNRHTRRRCNVLYRHGTWIERKVGRKMVPVGKRRQRRRPTKPH